jgi:hypothetical protein
VTVIAYDGLYVAADRMISNDTGMIGSNRKLHVFEGWVLATCGAADHGEAMLIWFKDGKDPANFPHIADKGGNKDAYLYAFKHNAPVLCFQTWPSPIMFPMAQFAAGCGSEIARTALHLGRDARQAAVVATELNVFCGMGVEFVDLSELAITGKAAVRSYPS